MELIVNGRISRSLSTSFRECWRFNRHALHPLISILAPLLHTCGHHNPCSLSYKNFIKEIYRWGKANKYLSPVCPCKSPCDLLNSSFPTQKLQMSITFFSYWDVQRTERHPPFPLQTLSKLAQSALDSFHWPIRSLDRLALWLLNWLGGWKTTEGLREGKMWSKYFSFSRCHVSEWHPSTEAHRFCWGAGSSLGSASVFPHDALCSVLTKAKATAYTPPHG